MLRASLTATLEDGLLARSLERLVTALGETIRKEAFETLRRTADVSLVSKVLFSRLSLGLSAAPFKP